jgi:hypothetical protein
MTEISIVRINLMTEEGYTGYCGNQKAARDAGGCNNPRTQWDKKLRQFKCHKCGWVSAFPNDFILRYMKKWRQDELSQSSPSPIPTEDNLGKDQMIPLANSGDMPKKKLPYSIDPQHENINISIHLQLLEQGIFEMAEEKYEQDRRGMAKGLQTLLKQLRNQLQRERVIYPRIPDNQDTK